MEAVILIGLQGAGKSTFYGRALAATHLRISMDLAGTRARERRVMEACLAAGQAFAVDNTNSTREQRRVYIAALRPTSDSTPRDALTSSFPTTPQSIFGMGSPNTPARSGTPGGTAAPGRPKPC